MGKPNHEADIQNANKGTKGTNETWDKSQGNRGRQLNPNSTEPKPPEPSTNPSPKR